jgi:HPt (histidine-containing phosphotransfer) domain-containing protein
MNDYVTKPFDPRELFAVLAKWVAPAPAEPVAAAPELPRTPPPAASPVHFALGLQRCMGRMELYGKIVARFLGSRSNDPAELRGALDRGDLDRAASIAHSMISTAGTLGAEALSQVAQALQAALAAGDVDELPALAEAFSQRHAEAFAALRDYLGKAAADR